jgi:hypothetical protein
VRATSPTTTAQAVMNVALLNVRSAYASLPDFTKSAQDLYLLNGTISLLRQSMSIQPEIALLQASVAALPNLMGTYSLPPIIFIATTNLMIWLVMDGMVRYNK